MKDFDVVCGTSTYLGRETRSSRVMEKESGPDALL